MFNFGEEHVSLMLDVFGLLISIAGIVFIILQLKSVNKSLKSTARGSIYDMASRIKEVFLSKPHLRKYFFDGEVINKDDENYSEVLAVADYYCLYLEQITTQKRNIDKSERESWMKYAHDVYVNSPVLKDFLKDKREWYSEKLWRVLDEP